MINIVIADHNQLCRDGLKILLEKESDFNVLKLVASGSQVIEFFKNSSAGLLILELQLPDKNAIEILKELRIAKNTVKILVLSSHDNEYHVTSSFENGANGFIKKSCSPGELFDAIRKIDQGEKYIDPGISAEMVRSVYESINNSSRTASPLTKREQEILNLIAEGLTNQEIAEKLFTSRRTVESHRKNIIGKTGAKNTASLIRYAVIHGIIN